LRPVGDDTKGGKKGKTGGNKGVKRSEKLEWKRYLQRPDDPIHMEKK